MSAPSTIRWSTEIATIRATLTAMVEHLANLEDALEREASSRPEDWVSTDEAAERFGLSSDTIRYFCRGKGCGRREGGRWLVNLPALQRYLKRDIRE